MKKWITVAAALCLALSVFDRVKAHSPQQRGDEVRIVPNGQRAGSAPGQNGSTYYALEGRATRVTTAFVDGTTALAERGSDGDLITTLRDQHGNELHRVRVDRKDGANDVVQLIRPSEDPLQAIVDPNVRPTLAWTNRQSHLLHRDKVISAAGLRWKNGVIRTDRSEVEEDELVSPIRSHHGQWQVPPTATNSCVCQVPRARSASKVWRR